MTQHPSLSKMPYETLRTMQLSLIHVQPGDEITLRLRNEERDKGIYVLAGRVRDTFWDTFGFFPSCVKVHPAHLAVLEKQGRGTSLDVTISEIKAKGLQEYVDLTTLPTKVPLDRDNTLDLFTAVACYMFRVEDMQDMAIDALTYLLKNPW